uniref:MIF4G domain-containing protein n=1 Tax=viral metagenome TaxID=1070528 RepID=A0A6C0AR85_9ZZZZ
MSVSINKYSIDDFNSILFQGFSYKLPDETLNRISELALQVGSPDYVKTPVFQKQENPIKSETTRENGNGGFKRGRRGKAQEIINDEDWNAIRNFQPTKIEEKAGLDADIDAIRANLNKLTDKNYIDIVNKIFDIIDRLISENITIDNMARLSATLFDIASTNRYYSKVYADLYSELSSKYPTMKDTFEKNLENFTELFNIIEYVDPKVNYDKFCEINKINEKRKALAAFYLNLMSNSMITQGKIMNITRNLLSQLYTFISQDNKKNEVDELTETVVILYKKELYNNDDGDDYLSIEGYTISEVIDKIANSKVKDYKSLTNKSLFKFMDLIDM